MEETDGVKWDIQGFNEGETVRCGKLWDRGDKARVRFLKMIWNE